MPLEQVYKSVVGTLKDDDYALKAVQQRGMHLDVYRILLQELSTSSSMKCQWLVGFLDKLIIVCTRLSLIMHIKY